MLIGLLIYLVGAVLTAGLIGGVRDEMEGIGDMAVILFWPLALVFLPLKWLLKGCYALGRWLGRKSGRANHGS